MEISVNSCKCVDIGGLECSLVQLQTLNGQCYFYYHNISCCGYYHYLCCGAPNEMWDGSGESGGSGEPAWPCPVSRGSMFHTVVLVHVRLICSCSAVKSHVMKIPVNSHCADLTPGREVASLHLLSQQCVLETIRHYVSHCSVIYMVCCIVVPTYCMGPFT